MAGARWEERLGGNRLDGIEGEEGLHRGPQGPGVGLLDEVRVLRKVPAEAAERARRTPEDSTMPFKGGVVAPSATSRGPWA